MAEEAAKPLAMNCIADLTAFLPCLKPGYSCLRLFVLLLRGAWNDARLSFSPLSWPTPVCRISSAIFRW